MRGGQGRGRRAVRAHGRRGRNGPRGYRDDLPLCLGDRVAAQPRSRSFGLAWRVRRPLSGVRGRAVPAPLPARALPRGRARWCGWSGWSSSRSPVPRSW